MNALSNLGIIVKVKYKTILECTVHTFFLEKRVDNSEGCGEGEMNELPGATRPAFGDRAGLPCGHYSQSVPTDTEQGTAIEPPFSDKNFTAHRRRGAGRAHERRHTDPPSPRVVKSRLPRAAQ